MKNHTIYLGADHGGFALKEQIKSWLREMDVAVVDCGANELVPDDDYPQYAIAVAQAVAAEPNRKGILVCRSGGGMAITANKVKSIRAVEVETVVAVQHAIENNHANIITISADWVSEKTVREVVEIFVSTEFSAEPRHQRRVDQIAALEQR